MNSAIFSILFLGLAYAMILYLIAVGLAVTMGLMHFINLGHGVFAAMGGYFAVTIMSKLGLDFVSAVACAVVAVALVGVVLERFLYRHFYDHDPLDQVMMSLGLVFISIAVFTYFFGSIWAPIKIPSYLQGEFVIGSVAVPTYRTFIIIVGTLIAAMLSVTFDKTRFGALLRATVENRAMAESVGINSARLFTFTFAIGTALAALGGALGAELLPIQPYYALEYLVYFLIIVVVGGLGNIRGSFFAAVALGIIDTAFKYLLPELGAFIIYAVTFILLIWRPEGIGRRAA